MLDRAALNGYRSPSLDHLEGKESQPPIRRNRKNNLQENCSVATQFRQKPLLGKAQSPISFNALEILHGRQNRAASQSKIERNDPCPCGSAKIQTVLWKNYTPLKLLQSPSPTPRCYETYQAEIPTGQCSPADGQVLRSIDLANLICLSLPAHIQAIGP
jgi:hypothetical protein